MKDKFFIGAYLTPPQENWDSHRVPEYKNPNFINDEQYQYLAEAGFTHGIALYEYGKDVALRALQIAQKHGIQYFVRDWSIYGMNLTPEDFEKKIPDLSDYLQYSSFAGLFIDDEPNVSRFNNIGALRKVYEKYFPGCDFFINLLPTYAGPEEQLGTETYQQYIDLYVEKTNPDYIMFDHYPIMQDESGNVFLSQDYLFNLIIVAEKCKSCHIPMRTFIQSYDFGNMRRDITAADIEFQINTNLAFGSQGILYFTYWTSMEGHRVDPRFYNPNRYALITRDGVRTDKYYAAKRIHSYLKRMESIYFRYRWIGVSVINGEEALQVNPGFDKIQSYCMKSPFFCKANKDLIIGVFQNSEGEQAYYIVNYVDPEERATNRISFDFNKAGRYFRKGEIHSFAKGEVCLTLDCGEGIFIY